MALGPDRWEQDQAIDYFCDTISERGVVVVHKTSGVGPALDDTNNVVTVKASPATTDVPAGLLLNDVVAGDPSVFQLGRLQDQVKVGTKCTVGRKGWWVTNMVDTASGVVPAAGKPAYLGANGKLTDAAGNARVGTFGGSRRVSDGMTKVYINIV